MKHYFNTTGLTGTELLLSNRKAEKQEEIILGIFKEHPRCKLTPFQAEERLRSKGHYYPITSIRRAMTNLTTSGKLIKSIRDRVKGIYGKDNHVWQYNAGQEVVA